MGKQDNYPNQFSKENRGGPIKDIRSPQKDNRNTPPQDRSKIPDKEQRQPVAGETAGPPDAPSAAESLPSDDPAALGSRFRREMTIGLTLIVVLLVVLGVVVVARLRPAKHQEKPIEVATQDKAVGEQGTEVKTGTGVEDGRETEKGAQKPLTSPPPGRATELEARGESIPTNRSPSAVDFGWDKPSQNETAGNRMLDKDDRWAGRRAGSSAMPKPPSDGQDGLAAPATENQRRDPFAPRPSLTVPKSVSAAGLPRQSPESAGLSLSPAITAPPTQRSSEDRTSTVGSSTSNAIRDTAPLWNDTGKIAIPPPPTEHAGISAIPARPVMPDTPGLAPRWSAATALSSIHSRSDSLAVDSMAVPPTGVTASGHKQSILRPSTTADAPSPPILADPPKSPAAPSMEPVAVQPSLISTRAPVAGRIYLVQEGDTLTGIAKRELGKVTRWAEIYDLNRGVLGTHPDYPAPGTQLTLPPDQESGSGRVARGSAAEPAFQR